MKKSLLLLFIFLACNARAQQCYNVSSVSYAPDPYSAGVQISYTTEDQYSLPYAIGFPFCFMGMPVTHFVIGSNGIVCFDTTQKLTYCMWPIATAIPSSLNPMNSIMLPWQDLQTVTPAAPAIRIASYGIAPNRRLVISFDSIPMYSCLTSFFSGQAILYETSNNVVINIRDKPMCPQWNGGKAILGLNNATGTSAAFPAGRNYPVQWTASNESWQFSPVCNVCTGVGIAEENKSGKNLQIFPNPASDLITVYIQNGEANSIAEISDPCGRTLFTGNIQAGIQQQFSVQNLPAGLYLLRIRTRSGTVTEARRFVKE